MSTYAGKVFMESPDGSVRQWVDAGEVNMFKKERFKVAPVRLRKDTDSAGRTNRIERTFMGDRVPGVWANDESVVSVDPGQESQSTPGWQVWGNNARAGAIDAAQQAIPMAASAAIPGVGAIPALMRAAMFTGVGGAANVAGQKMRGQEVDPQAAFMSAGTGAALGLPFEGIANYAPRWAPRMVSDVLRPSASQQRALEAVETRQGTQRAPVDYDRAAKQLLSERTAGGKRVMPNPKGADALEVMNNKTSVAVNDILDAADAGGFRVMPTSLVRSPEVAQLRAQLRKETDGSLRVKALHNRLKQFLVDRSTKGTPNQQATPPTASGVLDQYGNPIMTPGKPFVPGQPRRQRAFTANRLGRQAPPPNEGEKVAWRRGAAQINKARTQGTSTDRDLEIGGLVDDALARAAARRLEGTGVQVADPENPNAMIGVSELNDRLERRIPLAGAVNEHLRRAPMTFGERMGMVRGKLPFPDAAVLRAAYNATNPNFVPTTLTGARMLGRAVNDVSRRANK